MVLAQREPTPLAGGAVVPDGCSWNEEKRDKGITPMTQIERHQRNAVARLIEMREHNDALMKDVEAERDRLLTQGNLILPPIWSQFGPKPAHHGMAPMASPDRRLHAYAARHARGPAG